jgi:transcriptional regulator
MLPPIQISYVELEELRISLIESLLHNADKRYFRVKNRITELELELKEAASDQEILSSLLKQYKEKGI